MIAPAVRSRVGSRLLRSGIGAIATTAIAVPLVLLGPPLAVAPAAFAADECAPGVMARLPGPPEAFAAMGLFPDVARPTGRGITVAVVDSGVDASRPQLAGAIAPGSTSLISDGERPDGLSDPHGHGTAVAGIIAARAEAGSGVVGIAPDAQIISLRVFRGDDEQSKKAGLGPDAVRIAGAIRTATDLGAKIIVLALSDDVDSPELRDAAAYALDHGALLVASGGNRATTTNTGDSPRYPAAYPGVLAVTAVNIDGEATDDSIHGSHIRVAAPAQHVLTTATGAGDCIYAPDAPSASFATAYAAGAAALVAEAHPEEGPTDWAYRLEATADRPNPDQRDDRIGWGVIRPAAAIALRPDPTTRGPENPFFAVSAPRLAPPTTQVTPHERVGADPTALIAAAAIAASLGAILALGALLRRRRGHLAETSADDDAPDDDAPDAETSGADTSGADTASGAAAAD